MKKLTLFILMLSGFGLNAQTLNDYFKTAAANNPGLQAKYKDFEIALQKVAQVNTLPDPTLSFGYLLSPMNGQRAELSLMQMFPWFGTLKAQGDAATLMADAKYQTFLDASNQLYYQVAASYYPLYELNLLKKVEQDNAEILESYKNIANVKFKNGVGSMVDVLRVDIMLKDSRTNLQILINKEHALLAAFNKIQNRNVQEKVIIADSLWIDDLPVSYRKDSLLINHPLLKEIDAKKEASEYSELAARKQGLPKIGIGLQYMIMDQNSAMSVSDDAKGVFMPMASLTIPIFRSKFKAAVKEAQLMQENYSLQKEELVNTLKSGYEMIWFEISQQRELMMLYDQQVVEAQQSLRLLFSAYGNSGKEFEEVLRMQQELLKYEKMKASAMANYHIAVAKLEYITSKSR
ncbi:MAG: transporter [Sphingobacteriales bacterium 17-39-43]|uniref:TolC family protein n=1 Tax=Daejeonella sp. TaxID=2805397 RepID=UPI000BD3F518|nr:TolC family protein [Daejeonella sp.]OYY06132.1 MAG: transporter [Sphingobacteriia bacterium 35-40-5]OYZ31634.1 MAG: transporter [Sphingobacteriales bacterium 16-39-50]OZA25029.1 MAG: transporter [Sphingobacteriales bacterium 17-39-43]OZA62019.1 MAG: transporter [Sphingobacteriales bacterium 39-40-5]HQT23615.1 TolC family protein [Daejeonella sp.]